MITPLTLTDLRHVSYTLRDILSKILFHFPYMPFIASFLKVPSPFLGVRTTISLELEPAVWVPTLSFAKMQVSAWSLPSFHQGMYARS